MQQNITKIDVINVANSINKKVTDTEINWILENYNDYENEDPESIWSLIVENMLYNLPKQKVSLTNSIMHLTTHIQNKTGDIQSNTEIITSVTRLNHEYDYIQISSTEGPEYKPLKQIEISIVKNNEVLFKGTKYELYEILKQPNQHP